MADNEMNRGRLRSKLNTEHLVIDKLFSDRESGFRETVMVMRCKRRGRLMEFIVEYIVDIDHLVWLIQKFKIYCACVGYFFALLSPVGFKL